MLKAMTFPPELAEQALGSMHRLVELSGEQLQICRQVTDELEFAGELQTDFMKRLVRLQSEIRKERAALKELATPKSAINPDDV
jgi:hypothetical protein